jgi:hypothetical protein
MVVVLKGYPGATPRSNSSSLLLLANTLAKKNHNMVVEVKIATEIKFFQC